MINDYKYTVEYMKSIYAIKFQAIYWLLLLILVSFIIMLFFVKVDVSTQSRGIIRSKYENVVIKSIVQGRVLTNNIFNNRTVSYGDTLLVIDPSLISTQLDVYNKLLKDLLLRKNDIKLIIGGDFLMEDIKTDVCKNIFLDYEEKLNKIRHNVIYAENEKKRNAIGENIGVVSSYDYELSLNEYNNLLDELKSAEQQMMVELHKSLHDIEIEISNTEGNIAKLETELKDYVITSPLNGTIISNTLIPIGAYIALGDNIVELSSDSMLIVENYIEPRDIGFIKLGQKVKIQYDAFNYNQWGLGEAVVFDIDKNITITDGISYFIVRSELLSKSLSLKSGYSVEIRKGMTLTSRFELTRRTLWQLLFDKLDSWFNPKIIKS